MTIPADRFIRVWQIAKSIDFVCKELGITKKAASERASRLRSSGIPLQYFRSPTLDYDKLVQLAKDTAKEREMYGGES